MFTSGTLGEYSQALNSVIERNESLPADMEMTPGYDPMVRADGM